MYVIRVPVVSTVHLKRSTYQNLEFDVGCGAHAGAVGYLGDTLWVYVPGDAIGDECPSDLAALFSWAQRNGYDYIRLDGEIGDVVPGLPTFEEEWQ